VGRPEKSPEQHALHGTKPQSAAYLRAPSDIPEGWPRFKNLSPQEKPVFKRIARLLKDRRHLTAGDAELLRLYAAAEVRYFDFKKILEQEGWIVDTIHGLKPHPAGQLFRAAEATMLSILDRLGLSPISKDKPKPAKTSSEAKPADQLEEILARGRTKADLVPFVLPDVNEAPEEPEAPEGDTSHED
jgi:P27 family predicted phage terminase small subunit